MSAPSFVCQESFAANNATSCLRYTKLKKCIKHGQENHLNFLCVGANTISIGGSTVPAPSNLTMTPFMCTLESCPTAAPHSKKKHSGAKKQSLQSTSVGMTLPGIFVLALVVSQLAFF
ncbi:hypothetical protein EMPS_10831 [Entomortierella parvispora]|uniref:Uncharacterized protein n=1 Tax=Entomortierella parvispora TaxID=205924 RepID=A0A9P3M1Q5_9FUNG|nr:hypothetical protein EMPS_10831 [Entomortierella parvispora]